MYKSAHQPQVSMHLVSKLPCQFACTYTAYVFAQGYTNNYKNQVPVT